MSPLKMINLFQNLMPNSPLPHNVGLEVLRPAIFMISRTQLKPKNQVLYVRKTVNLSISAGGLKFLPNFQKKNLQK